MYTFFVVQCIFMLKLSMSSLKKMYSLVSNNHHPTHSLARVFFKCCYFILGKTFFIGLLLLILYRQLTSGFRLSDSSRLPFRQVFNNLSQKKNDFLSSAFRNSYDFESTVYYCCPAH